MATSLVERLIELDAVLVDGIWLETKYDTCELKRVPTRSEWDEDESPTYLSFQDYKDNSYLIPLMKISAWRHL